MHLKSLELNGFKSFAQKTILEFPKGITAIVGPNGSGKSNLTDSIRWILGERETKNLRGSKAEDLIFAGTPQKTRASLAQVAISFDNRSKTFPLEFEEVTVSREVSRDGNSNYFINKSESRAKDVIDFFARSRLGAKGIAIINQGSSDLFVKAAPEERRQMVEEILGLKEYQLKRAEAERKLKATALNLEKVKLMLEEVLPRLKTLKKQVARYELRDQKKEELLQAENIYFSHKIAGIKKDISGNNRSAQEYEQIIAEQNKKLTTLSAELKKIESQAIVKNEHSILRNEKEELAGRQSSLQRELGKIEARIEIITQKTPEKEQQFPAGDLINLLKDIRQQMEDKLNANDHSQIISSLKSLIKKIDDFFRRPTTDASPKPELENLNKEKIKISEQLSLIEKDIQEIKTREESLEKNLENFNEQFRKAFELKEEQKEEIRAQENKKNYLLFENKKLEERIGDIKNDWLANGRTEEDFSKLGPAFIDNTADWQELERKILRLKNELMSIGEIDDALIREAKEVEAHCDYLTNQSADLEKALADLHNLIAELKNEISSRFNDSFKIINEEFNKFFRLMFGGGSAKMKIQNPIRSAAAGADKSQNAMDSEENAPTSIETTGEEKKEENTGIDIELNLPKKRIHSLDALSGGEKSLVSIAALFSLISVSPPPFLVLDEIDAPLDEKNSRRFAELIKEFCREIQFIVITHNRVIMETADVLYGVTMNNDGTSKILSLKLE